MANSGQSKAPRKNKAVPCPRPGFFQGNFSGRKLSPTRHAGPSNFSCKSLKTIRVATRYSTLEIGPRLSSSRRSDADRRPERATRVEGPPPRLPQVAEGSPYDRFRSCREDRPFGELSKRPGTKTSERFGRYAEKQLVAIQLVGMLPGYLAGMHAEASKTRWPPKPRPRACRRNAAQGRPWRGSAAANRSSAGIMWKSDTPSASACSRASILISCSVSMCSVRKEMGITSMRLMPSRAMLLDGSGERRLQPFLRADFALVTQNVAVFPGAHLANHAHGGLNVLRIGIALFHQGQRQARAR